MERPISLSKKQIKGLDSKAINILGMPEELLIENAARGALEVLVGKRIIPQKVYIFAGTGNNGADSLALGRHLVNRGVNISIFLVKHKKEPNKQVNFLLNILRKIMPEEEIKEITSSAGIENHLNRFIPGSLIADGIFGIGYRPPLEKFYKELFSAINKGAPKLIAIDIPSGLGCDSPDIDEIAVEADYTVSFISFKRSFLTESGRKHTGEVFIKDIGISREILQEL